MRRFLTILLTTLLVIPVTAIAQRPKDRAALLQLSETLRRELDGKRTKLYYDLFHSTDPAAQALNRDPNIQLMYIDDGMPVYYEARNLDAARTISTDKVWPGGSRGYNLSGARTPAGRFAIWDVGGVLVGHAEFGGRVRQMDAAPDTNGHATAVAGTMVAAGLDPAARGMSYEALLDAYDHTNDLPEMAIAAADGLVLSNHSYGYSGGWYRVRENKKWYWYGDLNISTAEDFKFGFYGQHARAWDFIAYNAPHYLIVNSVGNDRGHPGPEPGEGHYHWWHGEWVWSTDAHQRDGGLDGYDTVSGQSTAKNILAVGAVLDIPGGYQIPADVVQTSFSSWGPIDDGRIKPDIVANGDSLYTTTFTDSVDYRGASGTSLASPNVCGSINLLVDHYERIYRKLPQAATLKALVINSADEAGDHPGPDYQNGWGLMNTARAADAITASDRIIEAELADGRAIAYRFFLSSGADVRTTIVWTDPPPAPLIVRAVDTPTRSLVNDLDLRVERVGSGTVNKPWVLDPTVPAAPAAQGDNVVDNVEQVDIANAPPGEYRITVSHKRFLPYGPQAFSIVCSEPISDYLVATHHSTWMNNAVEITWTMSDHVLGYEYQASRRLSSQQTFETVQGHFHVDGWNVMFRDESAELGKDYTYRFSVKQGGSEVADFEATITTPPYPLVLYQNRPNPFGGPTEIDFSLTEGGPVSLRVYDVAGRLVRVLTDAVLAAGEYTEPWDGLDSNGSRAASGVYFYRLTVGGRELTNRMVLVR
jgi:hypothetical protein